MFSVGHVRFILIGTAMRGMPACCFGVGNAINCFSSCGNPLGIVMSNKAQRFICLAIRFVLAVALMTLANPPLLRKEKKGRNETR